MFYVRNTESAGAIVPMVLDKTNACQRSNCTDVREWHQHCLLRYRSHQELFAYSKSDFHPQPCVVFTLCDYLIIKRSFPFLSQPLMYHTRVAI